MATYTPVSYDIYMQDYLSADECYVGPRRRTPDELAARRIGDSERIAIALIEQDLANGVPTFAQDWLRSIVTDSTFAQHSRMDEQVNSFRQYIEERDNANFSTEWEQHLYVERTVHSLEATIALADAVVSHRLYGEPDTDSTTSIGCGLSVTTSLAAAVVNYTRNMVRVAGRR